MQHCSYICPTPPWVLGRIPDPPTGSLKSNLVVPFALSDSSSVPCRRRSQSRSSCGCLGEFRNGCGATSSARARAPLTLRWRRGKPRAAPSPSVTCESLHIALVSYQAPCECIHLSRWRARRRAAAAPSATCKQQFPRIDCLELIVAPDVRRTRLSAGGICAVSHASWWLPRRSAYA